MPFPPLKPFTQDCIASLLHPNEVKGFLAYLAVNRRHQERISGKVQSRSPRKRAAVPARKRKAQVIDISDSERDAERQEMSITKEPSRFPAPARADQDTRSSSTSSGSGSDMEISPDTSVPPVQLVSAKSKGQPSSSPRRPPRITLSDNDSDVEVMAVPPRPVSARTAPVKFVSRTVAVGLSKSGRDGVAIQRVSHTHIEEYRSATCPLCAVTFNGPATGSEPSTLRLVPTAAGTVIVKDQHKVRACRLCVSVVCTWFPDAKTRSQYLSSFAYLTEVLRRCGWPAKGEARPSAVPPRPAVACVHHSIGAV